MIERLANDVLEDSYFMNLYTKAERIFAYDLFSVLKPKLDFNDKELNDLLRFADIYTTSIP